MTNNQLVLARITTMGAINKASRAHLPSPQITAMIALAEAIQEKQTEIERLILTGKINTEEFRDAKSKYVKWRAAWDANR